MQHAKYVRRPLFVVSSKANLSIVSSILRGIDWKVTFYHCRHVKEYVHTFMDILNSIWRATTVNSYRRRHLLKQMIPKLIRRLIIKKL